ncbi:MAG: hypothetical protein ACOC8F_02505 [Planctomycetota bacterium]
MSKHLWTVLCAAGLLGLLLAGGCGGEEDAEAPGDNGATDRRDTDDDSGKPDMDDREHGHDHDTDVTDDAHDDEDMDDAATDADAPTGGERELTSWGKADVGDSVTYEGVGGMRQTMTVKKIGDDKVHVEMVVETGGTSMPPQVMKVPRWVTPGDVASAGQPEIEDLGTETLEVDGKEVPCRVRKMTTTVDGKTVTTKTWTSDAVPGGTVKTMSDAMGEMQVMQKVVAFTKN